MLLCVASAVTDRARFSYMGSRGGPLWCRVQYTLPPVPSQSEGFSKGKLQHACSSSNHNHVDSSSSGSSRESRDGSSTPEGLLHVTKADGSTEIHRQSIWTYLEQQLAVLQLEDATTLAAAAEQLPFNFWGGFVGYLGYELKAECGGRQAHGAVDTPDAAFFFADQVVVVDHLVGDVYLLALHEGHGSSATSSSSSGSSRQNNSSSSRPESADVWLEAMSAGVQRLAQGRGLHQVSATAAEPGRTAAVVTAAAIAPPPPSPAAVATAKTPPPSTPLPAAVAGVAVAAAPQPVSTACMQQPRAHRTATATASAPAPFRLRHSQQQYVANTLACQAALVAGESYELCLTTALSQPQSCTPWHFYSTLRHINPAPYAAWMSFGGWVGQGQRQGGQEQQQWLGGHQQECSEQQRQQEWQQQQWFLGQQGCSQVQQQQLGPVTICCSSPERFLRGDRGGALEAKPIKGTAPRSTNASADAALAAALRSSEKERAENLMIVDLLRNDLGRVCEVGSVHVPGLIEIESYATVHQLVSTVRGLRQEGVSCVEAVRAAFPGGSMTGAPKIRSMEILDELEGAARGVYSGALGFFSVNDTFDLNIVIRTAVFAGGRVSVGAGGAITVQSDPGAEYEEMRLKARSLVRAMGVAQGLEAQEAEKVLVADG